jgi:hypothetical protein
MNRLDSFLLAQTLGSQVSKPAPPAVAEPLGWRREMERAQADSWFHGVLPQHQELASQHGQADRRAEGRPGANAAEPLQGQRHVDATMRVIADAALSGNRPEAREASMAAGQSLVNGSVAVVGQIAPGAKVFVTEVPVPDAATAGRFMARPLPGTSRESDSEPFDALPGATGDASASAAEDLPIRVHIEGDAEAATVWLGMNASVSAELAAAKDVIGRWLARTGYGPATWICNGRVIDPPRPQWPAMPFSLGDDVPSASATDSVSKPTQGEPE